VEGRRLVLVVLAVAVVGAVLAIAGLSRREDPAPRKPPAPASQKVGDDADLMRRLQRKNLVQRDR